MNCWLVPLHLGPKPRSIYVSLVSFFTALFFGDWMTAEQDAQDMVYDALNPYY